MSTEPSSTSIVKCLIPYSELVRLRGIEEKWNSHQSKSVSDAKVSNGNGKQTCAIDVVSFKPIGDNQATSNTDYFSSDQSDNRIIGHQVCDKVIVDTGIEPKSHNKEAIASSTNVVQSQGSKSISKELILTKLRKRFLSKGKKLLELLFEKPKNIFSLDSYGIVSLHSEKVPGKFNS